MRKKRLYIVAGCIALFAATIVSAYAFVSSPDETPPSEPTSSDSEEADKNIQTGDTFLFIKGETYYNKIKELSQALDETYNLYLQSIMSADEMRNQIAALQLQLFELQEEYNTDLYNANIDRENSTLSSKRALKYLDSIYSEINELFVSSLDEKDEVLPPEELALVYVVYGENLEHYASYFNVYYNDVLTTILSITE